MPTRKYEFTGETKQLWLELNGIQLITLHRIRALVDIDYCGLHVRSGDLGGWIEKEENLSHDGCAWIADEAEVFGDATVSGNAYVRDKAIVGENAQIFQNACISGESHVGGKAKIFGVSLIDGNIIAGGSSMIFGVTRFLDSGSCFSNSIVCLKDTFLDIRGLNRFGKDAVIEKLSDFMSVGPIGSRQDITTFYRTRYGSIGVTCGCFNGTIDEFLKRVEQVHGDSEFATEYRKAADLARFTIDTRIPDMEQLTKMTKDAG